MRRTSCQPKRGPAKTFAVSLRVTSSECNKTILSHAGSSSKDASGLRSLVLGEVKVLGWIQDSL